MEKKGEKIKERKKVVRVSIEIFSDRRLSILESLVSYLRGEGMRNAEVASC